MKNDILNLIKQSATDENSFKIIENIFGLYEQLQYATNIKQVAEDIFSWLHTEFDVDNLVFSLFDINKNTKEDILKKGKKFYLDDDLSHYFIVTTYTSLNATVSFCATSQEHSKIIEEKYKTIEATFCLISPIIQSSIFRKNYIDSLSLDLVMNVYSKSYLINKLDERIKLLENPQNEIYFLMIEIDKSKSIIDEFDYENNNILIKLAKAIYSNIKEFDIVGRLNLDMFLVSLNNCDEIQASNIAKKIIVDFEEDAIVLDKKTKQTLKKTISIGLEKYQPKSKNSLDSSIKHADIALFEAKNKGKSQFIKFSDLKKNIA